jgi:hypothetical protein
MASGLLTSVGMCESRASQPEQSGGRDNFEIQGVVPLAHRVGEPVGKHLGHFEPARGAFTLLRIVLGAGLRSAAAMSAPPRLWMRAAERLAASDETH